ncbi:YraN family protein [Ellagibacter isourolithinifaciens]|uniref:YraN family protein n=1 Tax=Ellagibacter isourolithinifaciens TaxID=2137581 RepID=UPI003AB31EE5
MSNFELQEKAVKTATRFIERKGYELLETGWTFPEGIQIDLIANNEEALVLIDVTATEYGEDGFEGGKAKRGDLEIVATS